MARILITGGCGFIGSNFIRRWLKYRPGDILTNLDLLTYAGNKENLFGMKSSAYRFVKGDICDAPLVKSLMRNADTIIHFAAETHVDRSILDSQVFLRTNILGTHTLLETARQNKIKRFIYISTDEVYGSIKKGKFSERSQIQPNSPYSSSKAAADLLCRSYWETYKFPVIVTRCCNNFGPYQFPEKVIPLFITNLIEKKKVPIYGKGLNVREWIYVLDHCKAIELVLRRGKPGEVYNIGSGTEMANIELAKIILGFFGLGQDFIEYVKDRPGHDFRYSLDSSKIRKLGWKPVHDFHSAMRQTIEWFEDHKAWWSKIKERRAFKKYLKKNYKLRPNK